MHGPWQTYRVLLNFEVVTWVMVHFLGCLFVGVLGRCMGGVQGGCFTLVCMLRADLLACASLRVCGLMRHACVSNNWPCGHGMPPAAALVVVSAQAVASFLICTCLCGRLVQRVCIELCMGVCQPHMMQWRMCVRATHDAVRYATLLQSCPAPGPV